MSDRYGADQIQVLTGLEAVRKRPGMYIGSTGNRGLLFLIEELVNWFIEEYIEGHGSNIEVTLNKDGSFSVTNDGLGFPTDINPKTGKSYLEMQLLYLSAFRKDLERKYFITGGLNGTGLAVINAVSEWLKITVWRNHKTYQQRYEKGKAVTKLQEKPNSENRTGTSITLKPDVDIFADAELNINTLIMRLRELACLNAGINITLQDNYFYDKNIYFNYPQGMKDYLVEINRNREIINSEVIHIQGKEADIIVEVVLQWCSDRPEETFFNTLPGLVFYREWQYRYGKESQEIIGDAIHLLSFANYTYTFLQGTHVDGVKQGIVQSFNNICSKVHPDRELQPTWTKLSSGLTGVVAVMLPRPEFEGPIKWKLANSEVTDIVSNLVESHLSQYLEADPQMIDRILL